ncbi:MAG TPA: hypothetical protein VFK87_03325 [Steroidobacteraceae bacterium]|nr:hypothetical protein [Steroidobacteraceae bacterium]
MQPQVHRLSWQQCAALWALEFIERRLIPLVPRGALRQRLRASTDRAQARLHERIQVRGTRD